MSHQSQKRNTKFAKSNHISRRNNHSVRFKLLNLKHQYHKMVKHTQTIRRQIADELFEYV